MLLLSTYIHGISWPVLISAKFSFFNGNLAVEKSELNLDCGAVMQ